MKKNLKNKKGFTLIELIVVIAILGILAMIAIPRLAGFQESSRKNADLANGRTIAGVISVMVANGDITTTVAVGSSALVSSDAKIVANLPNGVPAVQTTAAKTGGSFYYTVDVATGAVHIFAGAAGVKDTVASNEVYPTKGTVFQ